MCIIPVFSGKTKNCSSLNKTAMSITSRLYTEPNLMTESYVQGQVRSFCEQLRCH